MPGRRLSIHLVLCLSLLAAALPQSMGQVSTGDVVGRVIDASGAVLPNAKVTIKTQAQLLPEPCRLGTRETTILVFCKQGPTKSRLKQPALGPL